MSKKIAEDQTCIWCGKDGLTEYMFLYQGKNDWFHADCIPQHTEISKEFLFGGNERGN